MWKGITNGPSGITWPWRKLRQMKDELQSTKVTQTEQLKQRKLRVKLMKAEGEMWTVKERRWKRAGKTKIVKQRSENGRKWNLGRKEEEGAWPNSSNDERMFISYVPCVWSVDLSSHLSVPDSTHQHLLISAPHPSTVCRCIVYV